MCFCSASFKLRFSASYSGDFLLFLPHRFFSIFICLFLLTSSLHISMSATLSISLGYFVRQLELILSLSWRLTRTAYNIIQILLLKTPILIIPTIKILAEYIHLLELPFRNFFRNHFLSDRLMSDWLIFLLRPAEQTPLVICIFNTRFFRFFVRICFALEHKIYHTLIELNSFSKKLKFSSTTELGSFLRLNFPDK